MGRWLSRRVALAAFSVVTSIAAHAAAPAGPGFIGDPSQGLVVKSVSAETGYVTFAAASGAGLPIAGAQAASAAERALLFAGSYGAAFGIRDASQLRTVRESGKDDIGGEHVR